jgi:hypothetical protein
MASKTVLIDAESAASLAPPEAERIITGRPRQWQRRVDTQHGS